MRTKILLVCAACALLFLFCFGIQRVGRVGAALPTEREQRVAASDAAPAYAEALHAPSHDERRAPLQAVRGRTFDASGYPIAEAALALYRGRAEELKSAVKVENLLSDAYGLFEFAPVSPLEPHFVVGRCRGTGKVTAQVEFGRPVELMLERVEVPADVIVRVVDENQRAVEAFELTMMTAERGQRLMFRDLPVRSPEGVFAGQVYSLPGASTPVEALVRARGFGAAYSDVVAVTPGGTAEVFSIRLQSAPIRGGTVVDEESGMPIPGAIVEAMDSRGRIAEPVAADPHGQFEFAFGEASDLAAIVATADGYAPLRVEGRELSVDRPFLLRLGRGGMVAGQVIAADGTTLEGAWIAAWVAPSTAAGGFANPLWKKVVATDFQGRFVLKRAPLGRLRIGLMQRSEEEQASQTFDLVREVEVESDATALCEFDLSSAASLAGRVTLPDFLANSQVWVELHRSNDTRSAPALASWSGINGTDFRMRTAAVGLDEELELRVYLTQDRFVSRVLTPHAGEFEFLDLRFDQRSMAEFASSTVALGTQEAPARERQ